MAKLRGYQLALVFSLLLVSATITLGKQDPELKQCKHQCKHQERFDESQQRECEERCETYYREKQRREKEEGGSGGGEFAFVEEEEWNPQTPVERLGECERKCEGREQQHRPECLQKCVERYKREQEERRGGGGEGGALYRNPQKDPETEFDQCIAWCKVTREEIKSCERKCKQKKEEREKEERGGGNGYNKRESESESESESEQGNNPFVFQDEHFRTPLRTEHGRVRILQKFTDRSKLLRGIENYRVAIFEADPQTFLLPNHWDAESLGFVANGKGTISLVFPEKRESFNIKCGDIFRVPAGTTAYMINRDNREKLVIAKLLQPVSTPGNFEAFFGPGGENPESFYKAFSSEVLEAALNTRTERVQKLFGQQKQGIIIKATEEQIRSMSQQEEGGIWPFRGESKGTFNLFEKRPSVSNQYGRLHEVDARDYRHLEDLNVAVSFTNITKGGMAGPFYNSKATKIALVVRGEGFFEMACPHLSQQSESGSQQQHGGSRGQTTRTSLSYQKVRSPLRRGSVYIVPAGHPIITIASNSQNLLVVCFDVNAQNNKRYPLAGKRNVISQLEKVAMELSFGAPAREVEQVFGNQEDEFFFKGLRQQQQHEDRAEA